MKANSYKIIGTLIGVVIFQASFSQSPLSRKSQDGLEQNIISYFYRYSGEYVLGLKDKGLQSDEVFFERFWLHDDESLYLDFQISDLKFPLRDYIIYEVKKYGITIRGDSAMNSYSVSSFPADNLILIAYNSDADKILYLSGNLFKHRTSKYFDLTFEDYSSFYSYINIQAYNWRPKNIKLVKEKKNILIFVFYSEEVKADISLIIDKNDPDNIKYRFK